MYMNDGGGPLMLRGLCEIVVQDMDGDAPAAVAPAWVRRLTLPDGVHIIVATMMTMRRSRRFVVYGGRPTLYRSTPRGCTPTRSMGCSVGHVGHLAHGTSYRRGNASARCPKV